MIACYKSGIDLESLLSEVNQIDFWIDGSNAEMCVRQSDGIPFRNAPTIMAAVKEIGVIRNVEPLHLMINKLKPSVIVPRHRDFLRPTKHQSLFPRLERFHLIVKTNEKCWWEDEINDRLIPKSGYWYGPMPYWVLHRVGNEGETERIHLIVDLDTPIPLAPLDAYK